MSVYAVNLLRELVAAGHDVTMVSQYRGDALGQAGLWRRAAAPGAGCGGDRAGAARASRMAGISSGTWMRSWAPSWRRMRGGRSM